MTTPEQTARRLEVREMKNKVGQWAKDIGQTATFTRGGIVYLSDGTRMTLYEALQLAENYF